MKKSKILFLFCLFFQLSFCQEKNIKGKIVAENNFTQGITVVNLVNEKTTITDENGEFLILAKEDDLLVFSSLNFEYKRKIIEKIDFDSGEIEIRMVPKATQLEVITIENYQNLNAVSLGILEKPAKKYTPAERKLKTAGDFKPIQLLGILGGSLPIDPILNAINGRTKRLKKEINIEKREKLLADLESLYPKEYFIETLKIPSDNVSGFMYLAIEDQALKEAIAVKNKTFISLRLIQLAQDYNQLQLHEK